MENIKNLKIKPSKRKKWAKWILIFTLGIPLFFGMFLLIFILISSNIRGGYYSILVWVVGILSFLISLYLGILIIYFIILYKLGGNTKVGRYLKYILIITFPIIVIFARLGLIKAGVMHNWFGIESLGGCVDCKGEAIFHGHVFFDGDAPEIDGKICCPGTYHYRTPSAPK